jgi:hypothetical protein
VHPCLQILSVGPKGLTPELPILNSHF